MAYFKKIAAIALCLCMLVSLFSCKKEETPDIPDNNDPKEDASGDNDEFNPYPYEDLSVFMDLPDYKSVSISRTKLDELVNNTITNFLAQNDLYAQVFDRKVQNGDKVKIDFVGTLDGTAFQGGTASDYELVIGSKSFIDGFEDGVIGMAIGDVKDLPLKFPDNYHSSDLAGKEVIFTVTLDEIWGMPKIDDEFCKKNTFYDSAEEFISSIKKDCAFEYAWDQLIQQCKIKAYPDEYTEYYQYYTNWFMSLAEQYGVSFEEFLRLYGSYYSSYGLYSGMSTADFYRLAENYAESNLANDLLMYSLLRAENITADSEEFNAAKARLELEYGLSYEELEKKFDSTSLKISALNIALANRMNKYIKIEN